MFWFDYWCAFEFWFDSCSSVTTAFSGYHAALLLVYTCCFLFDWCCVAFCLCCYTLWQLNSLVWSVFVVLVYCVAAICLNFVFAVLFGCLLLCWLCAFMGFHGFVTLQLLLWILLCLIDSWFGLFALLVVLIVLLNDVICNSINSCFVFICDLLLLAWIGD